jgi:ankyrin repeat protein
MYAIQSINMPYFVDLGGVQYYDINFEKAQGGGFPLKLAAAKGSEAFVSLMLQNKMLDINKKDSDGVNAFWIAAYFGHGKVMSVLAESGIDVMNTDPKGYNVLHVAAKKSNVKGYPAEEIITMLIKSGFPLDNVTDKGETAVAIAAQRGNQTALRILVGAKANLNTLNNHNLSPLYLAILNDHEDATEFLIDEGALAFIDGTDV